MSITLLRGGEANCLATTGGSETKGLATPGGANRPSIETNTIMKNKHQKTAGEFVSPALGESPCVYLFKIYK